MTNKPFLCEFCCARERIYDFTVWENTSAVPGVGEVENSSSSSPRPTPGREKWQGKKNQQLKKKPFQQKKCWDLVVKKKVRTDQKVATVVSFRTFLQFFFTSRKQLSFSSSCKGPIFFLSFGVTQKWLLFFRIINLSFFSCEKKSPTSSLF